LELIEKLICVFTDIEIEIFIQVQTRCLVKEEEEEKNNLFLLSTHKVERRRFCNVLRVKNIEEIPAFVSWAYPTGGWEGYDDDITHSTQNINL
jgi:hypothetical protein